MTSTSGRPWRRGVFVATTAVLLASGTPVLGDAARSDPTSTQRVARCSRGLVALTFDDGPAPATTRRIVTVLIRKRAPATFFMVGERIPGHRRLLHRMHRHGIQVANHTFHHENLTRLSQARIRSTLRHTSRVIRRAGLHRPRLMRPPYGAIDDRVRRIVRRLDLTPVLWDVDSRDWDGRTADKIVSTVLARLDPGRNTVLLHDGVANSDQTRAALPRLIRAIRHRGYCLAPLSRRGVPRPPVPKVRVSGDVVRERDRRPVYLRFDVRLSKPTSRRTSVRVRTREGHAIAGRDFQARTFRLRFPVGATHRVVRVKVYGNARAEPTERMRLVLAHPRGLWIGDGSARGIIRDDD